MNNLYHLIKNYLFYLSIDLIFPNSVKRHIKPNLSSSIVPRSENPDLYILYNTKKCLLSTLGCHCNSAIKIKPPCAEYYLWLSIRRTSTSVFDCIMFLMPILCLMSCVSSVCIVVPRYDCIARILHSCCCLQSFHLFSNAQT